MGGFFGQVGRALISNAQNNPAVQQFITQSGIGGSLGAIARGEGDYHKSFFIQTNPPPASEIQAAYTLRNAIIQQKIPAILNSVEECQEKQDLAVSFEDLKNDFKRQDWITVEGFTQAFWAQKGIKSDIEGPTGIQKANEALDQIQKALDGFKTGKLPQRLAINQSNAACEALKFALSAEDGGVVKTCQHIQDALKNVFSQPKFSANDQRVQAPPPGRTVAEELTELEARLLAELETLFQQSHERTQEREEALRALSAGTGSASTESSSDDPPPPAYGAWLA